ncbi:MAG: hypothetical protein AB1758_37375 [Candidatus Eremiobacterota bacterium]
MPFVPDRLSGAAASPLAPIDRTDLSEPPPLTLREAYHIAAEHARTYGEDFRPVMSFADQAFEKDGAARSATWRFTFSGHVQGESEYSWVKIQVRPDGSPYVDPERGGPFPDHWKLYEHPELRLDQAIDPRDGMKSIQEGFAKKFPPGYPVSWDLRYSDRLKQTVMTYRWASHKDGSKWWCDVALNPWTGAEVERNAAVGLRPRGRC